MEEPASSSSSKPGAGRGRGKYNAVPRSERKSLEVFGGAPASTRYLPTGGSSAGGVQKSVPEDEVQTEESQQPPPPPPPQRVESPRIDPPWAVESQQSPLPSAQQQPARTPQSAPQAWSQPVNAPGNASPLPWEINLDIPEYKPKPVIGAHDDETTRKPVVKHQRSSSDTMRSILPDLEQERQAAINKDERQAAIKKLKAQVLHS